MVGVLKALGRDDLTDEITRKKRKKAKAAVVPPTDHVPQRQRHPGAVGQPGPRKVSSNGSSSEFLPGLAVCCSLDWLA